MPKDFFHPGYKFLARTELLSFEEIIRISKILAAMGVRKIRLTGGEPLIRRSIEILIKNLAAIESITDLGLTTNGSLLSTERAQALKQAGLQRITISLDSLDQNTFKMINDVNMSVDTVLAGIENAAVAGLPVKINMVVKKKLNAKDILPMAKYFHNTPHIVRFIEYMDVGTTNQWQMNDVVSAKEIFDIIDDELPLEPTAANFQGEVARRFRYRDGGGEIGIIASITQPFCNDCTRLRMSADGQLYTCLFANRGYDVKRWLRKNTDDKAIMSRLKQLWKQRIDRYSETRDKTLLRPQPLRKVEMSYIGG